MPLSKIKEKRFISNLHRKCSDPFPVQQPTLNRKRPAPENEENLSETKQPKIEVEKPEDDDFFIETWENWDTNPEDTENADTGFFNEKNRFLI